MAIHPVARRFFDTLVLVGKLRGPFPFDERLERPGLQGEVNFELTGDNGWTWHCRLDSEGMIFRRGGGFEPVATISMAPETFAALMRGEQSFATAQMTGRVRVRGDGHATFILGAMVTQFRRASEQSGWRGKLARGWQLFVLGERKVSAA
ncbi:MAG TPA: SCP2 sterol-binding domain-containing protein [Polyangiaceae bacterium]|nr:SCP2 sterol-binding domain-containing protein [Polyangiaceae bacterium]